ncbi:hypothetical protein M405DRAFT_489489 [Rhizopogon salebrosus TDB-379]|nr:hypothetical protein M405DRAFT_489489 [Rhizopogon salebrosus TDB-379]
MLHRISHYSQGHLPLRDDLPVCDAGCARGLCSGHYGDRYPRICRCSNKDMFAQETNTHVAVRLPCENHF